MSAVHAPLLEREIEPDEVVGNIAPASNNAARPIVLTPTNRATEQMATTESDAEAGEWSGMRLFVRVSLLH